MILKLPLTLARYSGLLTYEYQSRWYLLLTVAFVTNIINIVVPIGYFMILHLDNLDYFTNSLGAFSNFFVNLSKACMFLSATKNFSSMIKNLKSIAEDRTRSNYDLSTDADRKTEVYGKIFLVVIYVAVFGITVAPLLAMVVEYLTTGAVVDTRWELPFKSA